MLIIKERIRLNEMVMSVRRRKKKDETLEIWEVFFFYCEGEGSFFVKEEISKVVKAVERRKKQDEVSYLYLKKAKEEVL